MTAPSTRPAHVPSSLINHGAGGGAHLSQGQISDGFSTRHECNLAWGHRKQDVCYLLGAAVKKTGGGSRGPCHQPAGQRAGRKANKPNKRLERQAGRQRPRQVDGRRQRQQQNLPPLRGQAGPSRTPSFRFPRFPSTPGVTFKVVKSQRVWLHICNQQRMAAGQGWWRTHACRVSYGGAWPFCIYPPLYLLSYPTGGAGRVAAYGLPSA